MKLPDISKWNINKVTNMSGIFSNCFELKELPDISKWFNNIKIVENPSFFGNIKFDGYSK